jgi:hypothetical protein
VVVYLMVIWLTIKEFFQQKFHFQNASSLLFVLKVFFKGEVNFFQTRFDQAREV